MELFGILSSDELNNLTGEIIKSGTNSLLISPDWNKNIELCDLINQNKQYGSEAIKGLTHQLKSYEQKTVELSLIMLETCIKNCNSIPYLINKTIMDEILSIANGKKGYHNQDEALRLIQSWGRTFEKRRGELPIFYDTYMHLKTKGVQFPPLNPQDEIIDNPTPSSTSSTTSTTSSSQNNRGNQRTSVQSAISSQSNQSSKLQQDLKVVLEKVRLCREMLPESPGIYQDEILAEVIGFLEACQDRLNDLIEAGSAGVLNESDMELCLKVYESVMKTLEAEKNGTPIAVDDENTILFSDVNQNTNNSSTSEKKSTMKASLLEEDEEDAFANLTLKTPSTRSSIPVLAPPPQSKGLIVPSSSSSSLPSSSSTSATPAPIPISQQTNNDFPILFPASAPPQQSQQPKPVAAPVNSSLGTPNMTDDEFERFLNG